VTVTWAHQVSHSRFRPRRFRRGTAVFIHRSPSPAKLAPVGFILPKASCLFRVLPFFDPPRTRKLETPPMGLPNTLIATSTTRVVTAKSQLRCLSVLDVSHVLDGLIREWPCGFISPRSHVQGSLFRGFPSSAAEPPRRCLVPSRRCSQSATGSFPPAPRSMNSPSGLCSTPESVADVTGFSRYIRPIPS